MEKPKRLAEIEVKGLYPEAEQTQLVHVLGKEITILDMTLLNSELGDFAVFIFKTEGSESVLSTACGGYRVVNRLLKAKKEGWFPLPAIITKEGKRYEVK